MPVVVTPSPRLTAELADLTLHPIRTAAEPPHVGPHITLWAPSRAHSLVRVLANLFLGGRVGFGDALRPVRAAIDRSRIAHVRSGGVLTHELHSGATPMNAYAMLLGVTVLRSVHWRRVTCTGRTCALVGGPGL